MKPRWSIHLLLLSLLAILVGIAYLQEPGFGDDFTYWTFAHDLHEVGRKAWSVHSFHQLRWPVWGICWLLQGAGLNGFGSFGGAPVFYMTAGAICAFAFGQITTKSTRAAWATGIAFLFCPLLDDVCHRPMPDLSEGIIGGATVLAWWRLMGARNRKASTFWALLTGLGVYLTEANRVTGALIVPVLIVGTLLFARRRFFWLVLAGVFSIGFYALEAACYHNIFGDWLHSLNATKEAKDSKGIGNPSLWMSPFRFLRPLWKVGHLSPAYLISALVGIWSVYRGRTRRPASEKEGGAVEVPMAQMAVVWLVVYYLEISCVPQSIPWKPLVRDASRFLAGLSIPLTLLAVLGWRYVLSLREVGDRRFLRRLMEYPLPGGAAIVALLVCFASRSFFDLGYLPHLHDYVAKQPAGRKIFTHHMMRSLAIMADPSCARRLDWLITENILDRSANGEANAAAADEFWYMRKLAWLNARRRAERKVVPKLPPIGTYLVKPEENWALAKLLVRGDGPDVLLYRRRSPEMPVPQVLNATSPELAGLLPPLPAAWQAGKNKVIKYTWPIPAALRGKCLSMVAEIASNEVEPTAVAVRLTSPNGSKREFMLKPYCYREASPDFFVVPIPVDADKCTVQVRFIGGVKECRMISFRALLEVPLEGWD